jgi:hypothetical protein
MATGDGPQKLEWVDPDGIVLYEFKPFILSRDNEFGHPYNLPNSAETEHCFPTKRGIYSLRATISNPVETRVIENRMPNFLDSNDAENSPTIIFEPRISHQHSNVKLMWDANDDTNVNVELKNPAGTSIGNWTYNKDIRGQEFNCVDEGVYTAEITSTHLGVDMAITAELTASEYVDPTPVIFFSPNAVRQYREINVHWDNKVAPALHWSTGPNGRLTILEVFDPIGRVIYSTQEASGRNSLFPDMLGTYTATLIIKDRSNNIAASAEASIESKP